MATNKKIPKCPPLRFPEFADEWKQTTLGEIASFCGGGTPSSEKVSYWNGHIPWISSSDISAKSISNINITRFISEEALLSSATKLCKAPCIVIVSRVGVGKLAYSKNDICTSQDFCNMYDIKENYIFMSYLLLPMMNKKSLEVQGTSIKGITMQEIKSLFVSLPSLAEQEKIASFLSLIDERIESCSETIKEIKAQKSCLRTLILNTIIVRWIKLKQAVEQGIINLKRGEVIPKQSQSSENIYPVYSSSVQNKGLMGFHNSYMFDKELISWSIDGGGHLFYRPRHKFNVTNVCGVLETSCFDYVFLCEVLKEQHRKLLFDYQNKAHPSVIQELYQVPMLEISEQRYYGKLFRLLDERIEVEEELLKQYEMQKKYLLRQMFI